MSETWELSNMEIAQLYFYAKTAKWTKNEELYRRIANKIADTKMAIDKVFRNSWKDNLPFWEDVRNLIAQILELWVEEFINEIIEKTWKHIDITLQFWWIADIEAIIKEEKENDSIESWINEK